jgi:putative flippase GtrA
MRFFLYKKKEEHKMENKFSDFLTKYAGAIIGILIAIILLILRIFEVIVALGIIVAFAFLGNYIQKNKTTVKEKLKTFIDRF